MIHSKTSDLLARRRESLGPSYGLFYEEPLHVVRAEGVWMYGADGRAYLDAYNNVPVVGHGHPHVVEALARQARVLNTHTRYVTDTPVELAERMLATMPPEIDNIVFTCSGSEANDLAVRVSKLATGGSGFIITDNAYHGTSETTSGMSPSARVPLGRHVYTVPGPLHPDDRAGFSANIRRCVAHMAADGVTPAALLVDTIFSTDGTVTDPAGFLADAAKEIRTAGGLFIADEVQPGFGRTGEHMWGFARHGLIPDIVTMGKPMGNGHPLAAMAARGALMTRFTQQSRYFNTFGGNTVSCAVGLAVLDVIENEGLIGNARSTGEYLKDGLQRLALLHPDVIGDVRGQGLYCGVDILAATGAEPRSRAAQVVNGMRREGVLIGAAGKGGSVLKIRPPLPFSRDNADQLLSTLERVLATLND
jgi:4-aminobutyrate aminotransferase-like enzyme